jgi:hypothetical protein
MWTAIALIVIAGCALEAYRVRANAQKKFAKNDELAELQARIKQLDEELRERVEVLERIVTDSKADLKREFDYLDKAS